MLRDRVSALASGFLAHGIGMDDKTIRRISGVRDFKDNVLTKKEQHSDCLKRDQALLR